jgi:hypothetical protein
MTYHVEIAGWRPGFRKIRATVFVKDVTSLSLAEAKDSIDKVLQGIPLVIAVETTTEAYDIAHHLQLLGSIVRIREDPNLLDNDFILWLSQQLSLILRTPIRKDERLQATGQFMDEFIARAAHIAPSEYEHILNLIMDWMSRKYIDNNPIPSDKATLDWLEAIMGTIDGILSETM